MNKFNNDRFQSNTGLPLLVLVLLLASCAIGASAQEAPLMDGMGNINSDVLNADSPAASLYKSRCAQCHDNANGRIPPRASLRYQPPENAYAALVSGSMSPMAEGLSEEQIISLVKLLTGREPSPIPDPNTQLCAKQSSAVQLAEGDWSNTHGDFRGLRYRQHRSLNAESLDRLHLSWAYAYPGGAAGPVTVGGDALFLAGTGYVVALNAEHGCVNWAYPTQSRIVRSVTVATMPNTEYQAGGGPASVAVFGDDSGSVYAVDASSGKELWKTQVADHLLVRITAAPTVYDGVVYVAISSMEDPLTHDQDYFCCSARGGVAAVALESGRLLWKQDHIQAPLAALPALQDKDKQSDLGPEYGAGQFKQGPAGGSTYTPLNIDTKRGLVYASTAEEYGFTGASGPYSVIAYDLKSGERAWQRSLMPAMKEREALCASRETDCRNFFSSGTSAMLYALSEDKDLVVVGQKSGYVHALDPDQGGRLLWSTKVSEGGDLGGVMYSLAADADKIYVPISDIDSPEGKFTGTLVALQPATGEIVWRTAAPEPACNWGSDYCIAGQVAAVTVVSDMVFASFWDGYVRVYASSDGRLLREIDTALEHPAVNGVARGGQVSGYPVVVGQDALYITSGASSIMKAGNALLVYRLNDK